jgi:hypothetical protein
MTAYSDTTVTSSVADGNKTLLQRTDIFRTSIWTTAYPNNFASHFKFLTIDVRTCQLVLSFVNLGMFNNSTVYLLFRASNQWLRRKFFVNYFIFGSIPPRFEEGYETHVNICSVLINFDSFGVCY